MPKDNESTKWLYEQLKSKGYNVGKDQAEFDNLMRNNKASREWAYKTAMSAGLNVGKDQSEFDNLVAPRQQASAPTPEPANDTQESTEETAWKPTMQEKLAMNARLNAIGRSAQRTMDDFNTHIDNLNEYGKTLGDGHTVNSGYRFNPGSKRMERTYLTPTGERTFNKTAADAASKEYRDAVDMTVGGQIRRAQNRLQELKDKAAARQQELHDKWEQDYKNNTAPLAAVLARDTYVPSIQSDHTFRALQAAIHQTEEQIKTLNEQKDRENGVDVGFWRGFMRTAGDLRSWDFGINDMLDAMTMLHAQDKDRPHTEQEKAANQDMMRAIHEYQQTEAMYGGNANFWNRAGMMTGYMPSFMLDFALTGGGYEGINVASRVAGKAATKALGKEAVKSMAEQGFKTYIKNNGLKGLGQEAANWTIKALGTTTDELLIRAPLMTNTVQAGDTAADIINRKLGDVTVDENGNYDFTNDKTWGSAIWQGEANSIVENYSEMFGTHLPEVASLKNLGKLANVIGAKRLSGVLSRANAGALGGITDTTRRIFGQMGVSDYLGEVSEEYYGQLWRTMLNLDDAYQQNADGTRTNLFATKQFHGDIWGGMALSMGLMGAGKTTMSAASYLSMKHDVNKADAMASELLTPDVWEPLRSVIDMATNDNVGDVAEEIMADKELTGEEKAAVLNYMERSLYLRGANLAELVKSRGGEQDENIQRANDSYIDGYNAATDEEKQNAKNMYDLQRQKAEQILSPETLAEIDNDPMGALQQLGDDEEANHAIIDYINAKQVYDGMIQRVRDDIDSRIEQSNTMIDSRVNRATGAIQGVTMKVQDDEGKDRRAYVLEGNLVMLDDGTGIDHDNSDESIVIRDAATGAIEMVSPDAILSMEQPVDPELEKQTAAEAIRQQFAGEAANRIDGVLPFNQGDTYTLTDENGQQSQIQIVPNQDGIVDNGDGTVNVSSDGGVTVVPMSKDDIQLMSDATNRARVLRSEQQREAERLEQAQPEYSLNTEVTLRDEAGNAVRGSITADMNEDGQYEVYTESPINGRKVNLFTADELNALNYEQPDGNNGGQNIPENGNIGQENIPQGNVAGYSVNEEAVNGITLDDFMKTDSSYVESYYAEHPESMATEIQEKAETTADYLNGNLSAHDYLAALGYATGEKSWLDNTTEEEIEQTVSDRVAAYMPFLNQPAATEAVQPDTTEVVSQPQEQLQQPQQSALERIPKDDKGEPVYEQTDADTAWDAIVEQSEGDETMAQSVADSMLADKEAELKKVEKAKPKGGTTVAEKIAAERERKNAVEQAKATLAHWQKIAQTAERRRQVAMAEQARAAAETARLRREQEETERAEREEADRIRREALNGVPDIIDDKPQDARARGFRRVNGEKVDRQQPLQAKHGKEVQVKFDDKNIPAGRVSLIEAEQLQPSHVNGRRNPLHFIDEAQPKERNDEASVISARNIAANIRPEEITSSVTAYTGAPTVNARGEVIQGNNRSAALREMWAGQPEQAAKYKQYLAAHAADFGLTPEDVEAMQHPVLVNMIDVADDDAITLGQFVAQDTESGGVERIKPKNIVQKMGGNMRSYANLLLKSTDDEMSFAELVDRNGMDVLKWMQQKGYITSTQYKSAFDSKGNLTAEAKNDLKGIMYQSIFQNGNTHLEEMFGALPAKAQKAILATAYRDYDSPNAERMNMELQDSISAYYALSQMPEFANAKNYKEARIAAEAWKRQLALDDVTGESYLPSERYSNFAILLATMYKGQTQMFIQNTFKNIYDLVQGTQEETLFETPDNTPRTLVAAINEAINSVRSELLINEQFTYNNGQRRSNVLAGSSTTGQQGGQGSPGSLETGERVENGDATADRSGGTESDSGEEEIIRREEELASRVEVSDDDWQDGDAEKPTYKRSIIIDGKHTATQIDQPDEEGHYTGSYFEFDNKRFGDIAEIIDYIDNGNTLSSKIAEEEAKVNVNPTEAQKEAGNYKKGHVRIGQFDVSIEQPKGSVRSGVDASGNKWETTMQNTYGYIRGTEGVDGDHIDVFLTNDIDGWNGRRVYIVDQYNEDGTFDEHKVMLGFNDEDDARNAYLSNYSEDWANNRKIVITSTNLEDFEKWINSSHRKTKPFAEYQSVNGEQKTISPADRATEITNRMSELKKQADEAHGRSDIFEEARLIAESNELYAELRRLQQPSKTTDDAVANLSPEVKSFAENLAERTGMDVETLLSMLADPKMTPERINEFGRYNSLVSTADRSKVSAFISEIEGKEVPTRLVMPKFDKLLREFILPDTRRKAMDAMSKLANVEPAQNELETEQQPVQTDGYTVERRYHKKNGTYINAVKFTEQMPREQFLSLKKRVKDFGGYYSSYGKGGFIFETEEAGRKFAEAVLDPSGEKLDDNKPLSLSDMQQSSEPAMRQVDVEGLMQAINRDGEAKLSDHLIVGRPGLTEKATSRQSNSTTQETEQQLAQEENQYGASNKLVSRERYEELKKRMRQKLGGQMNMGIDPEILAIGTEMAAYHIEAGARKFADYARHMIDDLGDAIRPYLKSFYNGARDLPEVLEAGLADEMTPYDEVRTFDTANFDKPTVNAIETARTVVQEQEVNKQAEEAKNILTTQRNEKERQKRSRNKKKSVSSQQTPDLFGNVNAEQNQEDDNYGLQRNDGAVRAEGLPTDRGDTEEPSGSMGETVGQESGRPDRSGEESGSGELRRSLQQSERLDGQLTPRNRNNNHVERGTDYAPTTPKARYDANVEAVRLAKELTDSGQQATDEQKSILRQFSGWGGLGTFFNNERTRNELVALLGDDGYQQAAMSINSAYYTPADVIDAMWDIVKNLGFKGGNILEGSAGIGNILGLMPMDISDRSNIEAVEIDGVSGMILRLLYPDAKVDIQGFENTQVRNGSVDLAITNVPFVTGLHVHDTTGDRDLSRRFGNIHDFCIAKNVRKLREGGIGVFISSSGTLDKSKALRDWVVNEGNADFIGAFRLNNKTFGGTTATSDIIVVRKRINGNKSAGAIDLLDTESVRTVNVPVNDNGREKIKPVVLQYNKYFVDHPENMGGEMALNYERGETFRPEGSGLFPTNGINQRERMQQWAETFKDKAADIPAPQVEEASSDTQVDNNGNQIKDGTIVVGNDGSINVMYLGKAEPLGVNDKKVKGHTKAECVEDYNRIKRALNAVLEYETTNEKDDGLKPLLKELNDAYDSFKDKYGNLNKNTAISFLRNDIDFPSIQALEKFNETNDKDGKRIVQTEKTSIFTERVVQKEVEPHPTNVLDAVKTSVFRSGRIDLDYISNALGRDVSDIEKEIIDNGLGYRDPATGNMEVSYEYLSGNVRQKLAIAEANNEDGRYDKNIKALRKVMPMDIPAHLIEFTFGSSWVNPKLFSDYVNEKTGVPVTLTNVGGQWNMDLPYYTATEKNKSEGVRSEKLNKIVLGTDLMNAAINNRTITVSTTQRTWDGRTETITDKEATQACAAKIDDIRNDFKDWARAKMQSDPEMAKEIEQVYNERFNNYVPKTVTEEFMPAHFPGATKMINLYPHQKKAVIRATSQPLMLAHEVGTGKTFTLITTAMEMRRLGLARKPMIVVQNATVGQFVASAKELYPNAKVLTIADNERNEEGRKRFYAKIKYNDWDMIVVPQSVFERIPDSEERQMEFINDRIEEKEHVLEQIQEIDPKSMIARNAKRELDSLQTELAEVSDKKRQKDEKRAAKTRQNAAAKAQEQLDRATDDVENFDDMEIDAVLVDEAHEYKHLGFSTAMQRGVKGVDPSYSKKSAGVYLKTRAVMEKSNGKNVVFATGTPISNTAAEIWTFMRYLMPKHTMEEYGIYYFDDFVRNFGNLTQMLEFTTSGKFRENNRFSGYVNIPELIRIWSSVSDTVLTKETNLKDKLPETVDGGQKATDIYLPQSASLRSIMKAVRAELERFDNMTGKEKKENSAIPLVMYGIAKAAAIDPRLVMAEAVDEPVSKTNRAVEETLKSLEATNEYKGTVAIFCDTYQNNQTGFNIYEEIKRKLVERGVPENQIVIMRSGMSVNKKAEIFDKVNAGDVRVIMGSTFTLGTGVNIQERLNTLIHLDAPNRPMDYTQRNGRILRQGNLHKEWGIPVKILRFGVEDSLDITAYQRLKTKGAIVDSVMEGKKFINNNQQDRTLEEQEDVFGDTVAQLSGSEYALLKNQAERDFRKYSNKKKQYEADQIYVHNAIPRYEGQIRTSEETVKQQQKALSAVEKAFPNGNVQDITIGNSKLSDQKAIGDYIKDVVNKRQTETEDKVRKGTQGTKASSSFTIKAGPFTFTINTEYSKDTEYQNGSMFPVVHRNMTYSCDELGLSKVPVQRASFKNAVDDIMNNVLSGNDMRERIETENNSIERNRSELEQLKSREGKPFENEKELEDARKKVEEYTEKMRKEMEAKEKKYAEMDAQTQSADLSNLSGAEEAEEDGDTLYREAGSDIADVNEKFNEQLDDFSIENADSIYFNLGHPSFELLSAGIENRPIRLHGSKVVKKMKKHGFSYTELKDLPIAVAHPIAVFDNIGREGNRSILTELKTKNGNFLVTIDLGRGTEADFDIVSSVFGKNSKGVVDWINRGDLRYVDKEKALNYLHLAAPIAAASDNQELISAANIVRNFENPNISEENLREGSGALTDSELSNANDPVGKMLGKPSRTKAQQTAFAERERERMAGRVQELAEKLHLDNVDIVTDASMLNGRRARAKGFYSRSTGRITIVIPNHSNIFDVEQTLLHEAVAHYGLRQLFGEHFDTFLWNVYENADIEVRQRITELASLNGWDYPTATEEYLASLAENTNFENINASWWSKIKELFLRMLHKIGFENFSGVTLSDNELRYILWRSYENLKEPGRYRSILGEAADVAKQHELKVGNYAENSLIKTRRVAEVNVDDIENVNRKFNEELEGLTEENKDSVTLSLGRPSPILRAAGVEDKPMKLYGNKVIKKMKKHGFKLEELRNLPEAVANPITVFKNYGKDGNRSILTELKTEQGNFLVTLTLGEGHDVDFNVVTSVFGKGESNIIDWIKRGFTTYINKEKALNYLHHSALKAVTSSNQELSSAANIVKNFENPNISEENLLYRDGDPEVHERAFARRRYEERVKRGMFQTQEALQDSMLGLREAMDAILKGEGKKKVYIEDVDGFENAYLGENRLSSVNKAEADAFAHLLFKPLLDEVVKLAPNDDARTMLIDYMMAKHGLERNKIMAERDAQRDYEATKQAHPHSKKTLQDFIDKYRKNDYAGLTALTGTDNVADAESEALMMVNDYEAAYDTADLWKRTKDVSNAILSKLYETGMMSKNTYDNVRSMYEYYIPLRGFDEKTSDDAYAYLNSKNSAFNAPIKTARGRKSKANDPFAYLQSMTESAIMQGNRNKLVKHKFLNFVLNHPSDLASVSDIWLKYEKVTDEWKPVLPDNINADDTPEEVERKMQDFEDKMKELAGKEPDMYKHGKDTVNIPYRIVEKRDMRQHQVVVKRAGRNYVITINGNPRAAQALNGQTNPDNDISGAIGAILKAGERINRELSALYTTRNPDFVVSNFIRDMLYSNSMMWIKESPNYALRYHRNFAKVNPARMKILLAKYRKGTLDMSNDTERMFQQFMMNGGETGYANMRDIEKHKNDIRREIRKSGGQLPIRKAWDLLSERFDELNRAVENCARFAAFITSREMGRTIDRSIYDAKEISVNFNKKGSGAKFMGTTGQTALGNASAFMSGLGRSGFVFWNAAIQGTTNFGRQLKRHPAKALSGLAAIYLLGAVVASLGYGDDGDDDKNSYWNLPEYVRRSNILFRTGDQWISIPLPVEYRALYGLGELMISAMSGKEHLSDGELANAIAGQVSQILPLDILEGGGGMKAFIPSSIKPFAEAYGYNKSWTGLPIYKDTPYNKDMPEWTKAYKSANKYLVDLSEVLNEATGGDKYTKGNIDINPAKVEYVLTGYFGGVANTIDRLTKMGETIIGQREYDPKSFLILNRIIKNGDERTEYKAVNNEYFRLKEEHDKFKTRLRHYESDTNNGVFDYAEKIDFLYNSPEYERYEIFENYRPSIDEMYDILKEITDDDERKSIEADLNELKKMMISDMNEIRNRK